MPTVERAARERATWRSLLYVPANVRRFVEKAPQSGADAIILDLEDSVPAAAKADARAQLIDAVATCRTGVGTVLVRINRSLPLAVRDIEAAVAAGADGLLVTKAAGPEHIGLLDEMLDELEQGKGAARMVLVPVIETASAVAVMAQIAAASTRIVGMLTGAEDLAAECGCTADDELIVMIKRQMVVAAAAAGIAPLGTLGSVADFRDAEKVREVALRSRQSGFTGGTCVHPSLVAILNAAFSPSEDEIALAKRQVAAAEEAAREGRGSLEVDGRMVDEPILRRARRVLAAARWGGAP
jgi:citrate lyase subunit beta/citryl-CoA lyase